MWNCSFLLSCLFISFARADQVVTTLLGRDNRVYDAFGTSALLKHPSDVCISPDGTYFLIVDSGFHAIRKYDVASTAVTLVAGGSSSYFDGSGTNAKFNSPKGIAINPAGDFVLITDFTNKRLRRMTTSTYTVTTVAGSGASSSVDGIGTLASFNKPLGVAISSDGSFAVICDQYGHKVRKYNMSTSEVSTIAGSGSYGISPGIGTAAIIGYPSYVAISSDQSYCLVTSSGTAGVRHIDLNTLEVTSFGASGFSDAQGISLSPNNDYALVCDMSNSYIRYINISTQQTSIFSGTGTKGYTDGALLAAEYHNPQGITISSVGDFAVVVTSGSRVARMNLTNPAISTGVTSLTNKLVYLDGVGTMTTFGSPSDSCFAPDMSYIFILDSGDHAVRKYNVSSNTLSTVAGGVQSGYQDGIGTYSKFQNPYAIAMHPTGNFVLISDNNYNRVRMMTTDNYAVTTFAGNGAANTVNGIGTAASINKPLGIAMSSDGNFALICDNAGHRIRRLDIATANLITIAGQNYGYKNGIGTFALFASPSFIAMSPDNSFALITDSSNRLIRRLNMTNFNVSTYCGYSTTSGSSDGDCFTQAQFNNPRAIVISSDASYVLIADCSNNKIRKIDTFTMIVISLAGTGVSNYADGPLTSAQFSCPYEMSLSPDDAYAVVADRGNKRVRHVLLIVPTSEPTTTPSQTPTAVPTLNPTISMKPTPAPTAVPTSLPTGQPTAPPSSFPTCEPSAIPTSQPTSIPSGQPSSSPSGEPTSVPTSRPTSTPSGEPTAIPTCQPTSVPTSRPTSTPSGKPSSIPTFQPTSVPTSQPTSIPSGEPTSVPSGEPTAIPSGEPTAIPTCQPTCIPTCQPTSVPTSRPASTPSGEPTAIPTFQPTSVPTSQPTSIPSGEPTSVPSGEPTSIPSGEPTSIPTTRPTAIPSGEPTSIPSGQPTSMPSGEPSSIPSGEPTTIPTCQPTSIPSGEPTSVPTCQPTSIPSGEPTAIPTCQPSAAPSSIPTLHPSVLPTSEPSSSFTFSDISLSLVSTTVFGSTGSLLGSSVCAIGDINDDHIDDVLIGTLHSSAATSVAFVIYGRFGGSPDINLESFNHKLGFVIIGQAKNDALGGAASGVGDVNDDGVNDFVVSAPFANHGRGTVYVIYGKAGYRDNVHLSHFSASDGYVIFGSVMNGRLGHSVAGVGDVNGDGVGDLVVSSPYVDSNTGTSYLIYGRANGQYDNIEIASWSSEFGVVMLGSMTRCLSGAEVIYAGDVNGDGVPDFAIGEPLAFSNFAGAVRVILGCVDNCYGESIVLGTNDYAGFSILGAVSHGSIGAVLSTAGDINNDGLDDFIIGSPLLSNNEGVVYVIFGQASRVDVVLNDMRSSQGYKIHGTGSMNFGWSVAGGIDFNHDGRSDIVIGIPYSPANKKAVAIVGNCRIDAVTELSARDGFFMSSPGKDEGGKVISAIGDINGDGFVDFAVSATEDAAAGENAGAVYLIYDIFATEKSTLTHSPVIYPTPYPTAHPTKLPTLLPTTASPTLSPTAFPTVRPTTAPTTVPSKAPSVTHYPTVTPTLAPTSFPTTPPSLVPTTSPSPAPTVPPSGNPTKDPTVHPTIPLPSSTPTATPTSSPNLSQSPTAPSPKPTSSPTIIPTYNPSSYPTRIPSLSPTLLPTHIPTLVPTPAPTNIPSIHPTLVPSVNPTPSPTSSDGFAEVDVSTCAQYTGNSGNERLNINVSPGCNMSLTGSSGATIYSLKETPLATITITNFNLSCDVIDLRQFSNFVKFSDLHITLGSVRIHLDDGLTVILLHLQPSDMHSDHFSFSSVSDTANMDTTLRTAFVILSLISLFYIMWLINIYYRDRENKTQVTPGIEKHSEFGDAEPTLDEGVLLNVPDLEAPDAEVSVLADGDDDEAIVGFDEQSISSESSYNGKLDSSSDESVDSLTIRQRSVQVMKFLERVEKCGDGDLPELPKFCRA